MRQTEHGRVLQWRFADPMDLPRPIGFLRNRMAYEGDDWRRCFDQTASVRKVRLRDCGFVQVLENLEPDKCKRWHVIDFFYSESDSSNILEKWKT
jgi:hypothetical protein